MKEFKKLLIAGDTLEVICTDTENNGEEIAFEFDMKPFYFSCEKDLEYNVFLGNEFRPFDSEDIEDEEIPAGAGVSVEFMEYFCLAVPNAIASILEKKGIAVNVVGYEDVSDESERKSLFICDFLESEIKRVLDIDDSWHKRMHCRFSEEDADLLRSVGIDPCGDVPDEILALIRMGCPVLNEVPKFLKDEEN